MIHAWDSFSMTNSLNKLFLYFRQNMKCLGFLTSGGDAPGMNAAIRSIVRTAIHNNWTPFAINGGFNGLLDGDITEMTWEDVTFILSSVSSK